MQIKVATNYDDDLIDGPFLEVGGVRASKKIIDLLGISFKRQEQIIVTF